MIVKDLNTCIDILIQAANIGQSKGIYTIKEAGFISAAMEFLEELSTNNDEENTKEKI